jgi:hypothetical protein
MTVVLLRGSKEQREKDLRVARARHQLDTLLHSLDSALDRVEDQIDRMEDERRVD